MIVPALIFAIALDVALSSSAVDKGLKIKQIPLALLDALLTFLDGKVKPSQQIAAVFLAVFLAAAAISAVSLLLPLGFLIWGVVIWLALDGAHVPVSAAQKAPDEAISELASGLVRVCAALLYAAIGGPVLAALYLTSRLLEKSRPHLALGASKINYYADFLPYRAAALAIAAMGALRFQAGFMKTWDAALKDSQRVNITLCAMANALGVIIRDENANITGGGQAPTDEDIHRGVKLFWASYALMAFIVLGLTAIVSL